MAREKRSRTCDASQETERQKVGFTPWFWIPDGVELFNWSKKKDKYKQDIIPYEVKKGDYRHPDVEVGRLAYQRILKVHRMPGAGGHSWICLNQKGLPVSSCPICEEILKMEHSTNPTLNKLAKRLKAKDRQLFNTIDRDEKKKGIQLWEIAFFNFGKLLRDTVNKRDKNDDEEKNWHLFPDPKKGYTLKITTGEEALSIKGEEGEEGATFKFTKAVGIRFSKRETPYSDEIIDEAINLDEVVEKSVMSYKDMKKEFLKGLTTDDDDDDDDEPKKKKKKAKEEDDGDDSDSEEDEDEESDDDSDDDDEDEADEDDDEESGEDDDSEDDDEESDDETAKDAGIKVDSVVDHDEFGECTVKKISGDGTSLTLQDAKNKIHKAIAVSECLLVEDDEADDDEPKKKKKKSSKDDDDENEEEEDDDSEEDEEEDEDDDDEEEDEEKPAKKKKKRK